MVWSLPMNANGDHRRTFPGIHVGGERKMDRIDCVDESK